MAQFFYNVGTASVSNGAKHVVFSGALLGSADDPVIKPGDWLEDPAQPNIHGWIDTVDYDAGTAELLDDWSGTTMASAAYRVWFIADQGRLAAFVRAYITALEAIPFVAASNAAASYLDLFEQATNGAHRVRLAAAANLGADLQVTFDANAVDLLARWTKATSAGPSSLAFFEDTDNGANKATLKGPASLSGDIDVMLPSDAGTLLADLTGTWTPALTFATPGNLSVTYSVQSGWYRKFGKLVIISFRVVCTAFTHTTASGALRITGLPFASASLSGQEFGAMRYEGITKASYVDFGMINISGETYLEGRASGSGVSLVSITAADMPSGGVPTLNGIMFYLTA